MQVVRTKIKPEIAEEHSGIVKGKSTSNAVYTLRMLAERALQL